jgi:diacylglycerol O-acyltransferase / trehalose O-mycolyltransferase
VGTPGWPFPLGLWGDRIQRSEIWRRRNPVDAAANPRGISLFVSYGDGDPGPLDVDLTPAGVGGQIERRLAPGSAAFVRRLGELGIPAQVDAYGPGSHAWPYWQWELHRALPGIMRTLLPSCGQAGLRGD